MRPITIAFVTIALLLVSYEATEGFSLFGSNENHHDTAAQKMRHGLQEGAEDVRMGVKGAAHELKKDMKNIDTLGEGVKEAAYDLKEGVKAGSQDMKMGYMKEGTNDMWEGVKDSAWDIKEGVKAGASNVKEGAHNLKENLKDKFHRNPNNGDPATYPYDQPTYAAPGGGKKHWSSEAKENIQESAKDAKEWVHDKKLGTEDKLHDTKENLKDKMHGAKENLKDKMHDAKENLKEKAHESKDWLHDVKENIKDKAHHLKEDAKEWLHRHKHDPHQPQATHGFTHTTPGHAHPDKSTINDL